MIIKTINDAGETRNFPLTVSFLESGVARVTVDEEKRQKGDITLRHDSKARKERSDEVEKWAIVGGLKKDPSAKLDDKPDAGTTAVLYGENGKHRAVVQHEPFQVEFQRNGETHIAFNSLGLMNFEHWRPKVEPKEGETAPEEEETWWEESFGGNTDSKPRGPESVGMDFRFVGYSNVYGIPEHSGPLSLRETKGGKDNFEEPYRMHNSDVFEYLIDSPMTLYGSIPFMQAQRKDSTVGIFWLNAAETWVDIKKDSTAQKAPGFMGNSWSDTYTHWFSESGLLDVFVMLGPTPKDMNRQYGELTGTTQLPQMFSIGYHQCRWNYITDEDVRDVDRKFDRHNIPYDVIWLDIEYLDGKKFFTWDPMTFSDPLGMQKQLDEHDRKLVVIIDPHIKKEDGYTVVQELQDKGLAVANKDASIYEGWCWPGAAYWVDCFHPKARDWIKTLYSYAKFASTAPNLFIWNDMNEPSVFNGPETTMPKDNIHSGGWEHRDIHNVNGLTFVNATFHALAVRDDPKGKTPTTRPFILTRSFYAGSQRLGAMWTGDNQAEWSHLAGSLPMVLANGIAGFPFAGADVGGFFGNPSSELLARWYQAGAFYPFFRGHAHIDTRRREPYLAPEPYRTAITAALRLRYSLLPAWYTAFHTASVTGYPIVRPMWWTHPSDEAGFALGDQLYLGDTGLLAKPVTSEGATTQDIYLPPSDRADGTPVPYYDYDTYAVLPSGPATKGATHRIAAPLDKIPLLMRAGHVFPRRDRPRRSAGLMAWDPFTLVVVLDPAAPAANGSLYHDDGATYAHETGARIHRSFTYASGTLSSADIDSIPSSMQKTRAAYVASLKDVTVEKILIIGAPKAWAKIPMVTVSEGGAGREVEMDFHAGAKGHADWAVVRKPGVGIAADWRVRFE